PVRSPSPVRPSLPGHSPMRPGRALDRPTRRSASGRTRPPSRNTRAPPSDDRESTKSGPLRATGPGNSIGARSRGCSTGSPRPIDLSGRAALLSDAGSERLLGPVQEDEKLGSVEPHRHVLGALTEQPVVAVEGRSILALFDEALRFLAQPGRALLLFDLAGGELQPNRSGQCPRHAL